MFCLVQIKYYLPKIIPLIILMNVFIMSRVIELKEFSEKRKEKDPSNFYMEGSQNIDMTDFKLLINNNICDEEEINIITIVSTAVENKAG